MEYPLVTAFTLIYNTNPQYVIDAIISVRNNNYPNLQHIIVDDCSPNPIPKQVVKDWIKENSYECEFYENEVNLGICKNLNYILSLVKGKYYFGVSDDLIASDRIITDVQKFETLSEEYAIVFGLTQEMDSNSVLKPRVFPSIEDNPSDLYKSILVNGNFIAAPSVTYRTSIIKKIGGYNENILFEDYEMWLKLSFIGYKLKNIPKIQSYYRIHDESISFSLNFDLENLKILSLFSKEKGIREKMFEKVWSLLFEKKNGYKEALKIYENSYDKSFKLRLASMVKSILILKALNLIFKLNVLKQNN